MGTRIACFVFLIVLSPSLRAQTNEYLPTFLLFMANSDIPRLDGRIFSHLDVCQRFPSRTLLRADPIAVRWLRKEAIPFTRLNSLLEGHRLAVVSMTSVLGRQLAEVPSTSRILGESDNIAVISGTDADVLALRQAGFSCTEIGLHRLPLVDSRIYLPPQLEHRVSVDIDSMIARVSDGSIAATIIGLQDFGTRHWSKPNRDSMVAWVRNEFLAAGVNDVTYDEFSYNGTVQKNIVATIPGSIHPSQIILVGGHIDSQSSDSDHAPGADDNASGAAAALEMARVIEASGYVPSMTLRFMGFAAEEAGLIGSARYAAMAFARGDDIRLVMNYDMIGNRDQTQADRQFNINRYPKTDSFGDLYSAMAERYTMLEPLSYDRASMSTDSWSFYQHGYEALYMSETDFSPYYHSPNDLSWYLDMPYAADIVRAGLGTLLVLDQLPPSVSTSQIIDRGDGSSLRVSWNAVNFDDFASYLVRVGTLPGHPDTSYTSTSTTYDVGELSEGTLYFIGVAAVDLAGQSGMILERSGIPRSIPLAPLGLAGESAQNAVRLHWNANLELDLLGYEVFRQSWPDTQFTLVTLIPVVDTSLVDSALAPGVYQYTVVAVDNDWHRSNASDTVTASPVVAVGSNDELLPQRPWLAQNYPNPSNPTTIIRYRIPHAGFVSLRIYDLLGREMTTVVSETLPAGDYYARVDVRELGLMTGVYYYTLSIGSFTDTRKMVVLR